MRPGLLDIYARAGRRLDPLVRRWLAFRARRGQEDPARLGERLGIPSLDRPPGPLLWCHAVSVGEALAVLPLVEAILAARPRLGVLMTTATPSSARLIAERRPAAVLHQMAPVDLPQVATAFLEHWRPDLALFAESELWPNLLAGLGRRGCPTILVNAKLSDRAFRRWRLVPSTARAVLGNLTLALAQTAREAERLAALGAPMVEVAGSLKYAAAPLPFDPEQLARAREAVAGRRVWVAASTHQGEEAVIARVHDRVAADVPGLLTILVPRHPERGQAIGALLRRRGLSHVRHALGQRPKPGTQIWLADTLGELGLWYRLAELAFVGGSLVRYGGHNVLEPARLGRPVLIGPDTRNIEVPMTALAEAGALLQVADGTGLASAVTALFADPARMAAMSAAGARVAATTGGIGAAILQRLEPWLPAPTDGPALPPA